MSERPEPDYIETVPDDVDSPAYHEEDDDDEEEEESKYKNPFNEDLSFPSPVACMH